MGAATKKWEKVETKLRNISKQSRKSVESVLKKKLQILQSFKICRVE